MRFVVADLLRVQLQAWRERRAPHDVFEREHDAFCLDGGLGPAFYLTTQGLVLRDGVGWDDEPVREAPDAEAVQALVVGAKKTGIRDLLDLLPDRSPAPRRALGVTGLDMLPLLPLRPPTKQRCGSSARTATD